MKITCKCGHSIPDIVGSSTQAHLIPDENLESLFNQIDKLLEHARSGEELEGLFWKMRQLVNKNKKSMRSCVQCGRIVIYEHIDEILFYQNENVAEIKPLSGIKAKGI